MVAAVGPPEMEHDMILPRRLRGASLLLVLVAGPLAAATTSSHRPPKTLQSRAGSTGMLSEAWTFMSRVWRNAGLSADFFQKAGSSTDPFGNPAPTTVQAPSIFTPQEKHPAGQ
jgi:hypothetical protein